MNNIYEMFNDANIDFSEYMSYDLENIEKKKMKKSIKKKLDLDHNKITKKGTIAVAAVIALTLTSTAFISKNAFAKVFGTSIEELINHKDDSLKDYKSVINKDVTENGISAKLN